MRYLSLINVPLPYLMDEDVPNVSSLVKCDVEKRMLSSVPFCLLLDVHTLYIKIPSAAVVCLSNTLYVF